MKRLFSKSIGLICLAVMLLSVLPVPVLAAGSMPRFELKINQVFEDKRSAEEQPPAGTNTGQYRLTALEPEDAPMPAGASDGVFVFTIADTASYTLQIDFAGEGTFEYELEQISENEDPHYTYAEEVYEISVTTESEGEDIVIVSSSVKGKEDGNKYYEVTYKNTVEAGTPYGPDPVSTDPPVKKVIIGDEPEEEATFLFEMTADDPSWPMPEGSENGVRQISITGEGEVEFGEIFYEEEDLDGADTKVFSYTVHERNTGEEGYTYDRTRYRVTVTISHAQSGDLECERVITRYDDTSAEPEECATCLFTNSYARSTPPTPSDPPSPGPSGEPSSGPSMTPAPSSTPGSSTTTTKSSGSSDGKATSVKTGDTNMPVLWISVFLAAGLFFIVLAAAKRRRR